MIGELITDIQRHSIIAFDKTYVSKRICYDQMNEQFIGPHRSVQTVVFRGIVNYK